MYKIMIEDIQNRVRNHLSPFQTAIDYLNLLKKASYKNDDAYIKSLVKYIQTTDLINTAQEKINWFISLGAAMDRKINDETFDVEQYISEMKSK